MYWQQLANILKCVDAVSYASYIERFKRALGLGHERFSVVCGDPEWEAWWPRQQRDLDGKIPLDVVSAWVVARRGELDAEPSETKFARLTAAVRGAQEHISRYASSWGVGTYRAVADFPYHLYMSGSSLHLPQAPSAPAQASGPQAIDPPRCFSLARDGHSFTIGASVEANVVLRAEWQEFARYEGVVFTILSPTALALKRRLRSGETIVYINPERTPAVVTRPICEAGLPAAACDWVWLSRLSLKSVVANLIIAVLAPEYQPTSSDPITAVVSTIFAAAFSKVTDDPALMESLFNVNRTTVGGSWLRVVAPLLDLLDKDALADVASGSAGSIRLLYARGAGARHALSMHCALFPKHQTGLDESGNVRLLQSRNSLWRILGACIGLFLARGYDDFAAWLATPSDQRPSLYAFMVGERYIRFDLLEDNSDGAPVAASDDELVAFVSEAKVVPEGPNRKRVVVHAVRSARREYQRAVKAAADLPETAKAAAVAAARGRFKRAQDAYAEVQAHEQVDRANTQLAEAEGMDLGDYLLTKSKPRWRVVAQQVPEGEDVVRQFYLVLDEPAAAAPTVGRASPVPRPAVPSSWADDVDDDAAAAERSRNAASASARAQQAAASRAAIDAERAKAVLVRDAANAELSSARDDLVAIFSKMRQPLPQSFDASVVRAYADCPRAVKVELLRGDPSNLALLQTLVSTPSVFLKHAKRIKGDIRATGRKSDHVDKYDDVDAQKAGEASTSIPHATRSQMKGINAPAGAVVGALEQLRASLGSAIVLPGSRIPMANRSLGTVGGHDKFSVNRRAAPGGGFSGGPQHYGGSGPALDRDGDEFLSDDTELSDGFVLENLELCSNFPGFRIEAIVRGPQTVASPKGAGVDCSVSRADGFKRSSRAFYADRSWWFPLDVLFSAEELRTWGTHPPSPLEMQAHLIKAAATSQIVAGGVLLSNLRPDGYVGVKLSKHYLGAARFSGGASHSRISTGIASWNRAAVGLAKYSVNKQTCTQLTPFQKDVVTHQASTEPGYCGMPIVVGDKVVAMHVASSGYGENVQNYAVLIGACVPFSRLCELTLECLLQDAHDLVHSTEPGDQNDQAVAAELPDTLDSVGRDRRVEVTVREADFDSACLRLAPCLKPPVRRPPRSAISYVLGVVRNALYTNVAFSPVDGLAEESRVGSGGTVDPAWATACGERAALLADRVAASCKLPRLPKDEVGVLNALLLMCKKTAVGNAFADYNVPQLKGVAPTKYSFVWGLINHPKGRGPFEAFVRDVLSVVDLWHQELSLDTNRAYVHVYLKQEPVPNLKFRNRARTIKEFPLAVTVAMVLHLAWCDPARLRTYAAVKEEIVQGSDVWHANDVVKFDDLMYAATVGPDGPKQHALWLVGHDLAKAFPVWFAAHKKVEKWFMADVSAWDKSLPPQLVAGFFRGATGDQKVASWLSRWCCGDSYLYLDGRLYEPAGPSWVSGNPATLSGNTIMHAAILREASPSAGHFLVQGDDAVCCDKVWSKALDAYKRLGMTVKSAAMGTRSAEFCKVFVGGGQVGLELESILAKTALKATPSLPALRGLVAAFDWVAIGHDNPGDGIETARAVAREACRSAKPDGSDVQCLAARPSTCQITAVEL